MKKTLTMGAFEALDQQEMLEVEGGGNTILEFAYIVYTGNKITKQLTGKTAVQHVIDFFVTTAY